MKTNREFITTGVARVLFGRLLEPMTEPYPQPRYRADLLIPKADAATVKLIKAAIADAAVYGLQNKWHDVDIENIMLPIRDGDMPRDSAKPKEQKTAGCMVVSAASLKKPDIYNMRMQPIDSPDEIYNGVYVCASLSFTPYIYNGVPGIRAVLRAVMKVCDGALIQEQTPAQQALSAAAKKLHRQMINGMVTSVAAPTLREGEDIPYNYVRNEDVPPIEEMPYFPHHEDEQEHVDGAALSELTDTDTLNDACDYTGDSPDEAETPSESVVSDDNVLEARMKTFSNKSVSLEDFKKIMMPEPA